MTTDSAPSHHDQSSAPDNHPLPTPSGVPISAPSGGALVGSLAGALERLVAAGTLTPEQAVAVQNEVALDAELALTPGITAASGSGIVAEPSQRYSIATVLAEVGGYVGGAFVLASAVVLTGRHWIDLSQWQRLAVLGVPAALIFAAVAVLALMAPGGWSVRERAATPDRIPEGARRRLVATLIGVAGALTAGVAAVLTPADWDQISFSMTAFAISVGGYLACRSVLLHATTLVTLGWAGGSVLDRATHGGSTSTGWVLVAIGIGWVGLTLKRLLDEQALGLAGAGAITFIGGEILATDVGNGQPKWPGYVVLGVLAVAGLVGYVRTRQVAVLVVGVVALATAVPQSIIDYTDGALGTSGALLITGLSIVGASVLGLRLRREPSGSRR